MQAAISEDFSRPSSRPGLHRISAGLGGCTLAVYWRCLQYLCGRTGRRKLQTCDNARVQSCGHLSTQDPLHAYLCHHVLPQIGAVRGRVDFRVFSMKHAKVYLYEESHTRLRLVGKFFSDGGHDGYQATQRMWQEFENLQVLRG